MQKDSRSTLPCGNVPHTARESRFADSLSPCVGWLWESTGHTSHRLRGARVWRVCVCAGARRSLPPPRLGVRGSNQRLRQRVRVSLDTVSSEPCGRSRLGRRPLGLAAAAFAQRSGALHRGAHLGRLEALAPLVSLPPAGALEIAESLVKEHALRLDRAGRVDASHQERNALVARLVVALAKLGRNPAVKLLREPDAQYLLLREPAASSKAGPWENGVGEGQVVRQSKLTWGT
mmetsp:Transcript_5164/g.17032  ORF Transcript_5164/g.17032 Transcript_5164/m.17032 type:complete len:233 (+) Transcript_5164:1235-1933(+)